MDRLLDQTEKEKEKYTIMTAKDIASAKLSAEAHLDSLYGTNEIVGMKRKAIDPLEEQRKRAALMELGHDEKIEEELAEIDTNIYFSINYDQFNMMFRNNSVIDFATERINRSAGQVVKAFFDYGKDKIKSIKELDSPSATPVHIANMLSKTDMVSRGDIVLPKDPLEPNKKPSLQETIRGYISLLKMDPAGFVKSKDDRGANHFAVNFEKLRQTMKRQIVEGLVRERYGVATCRILKILMEKGKLEESQVQKLAMLPAKDTREKLALLMTKGFVEIQEVPRTADRAPGRCFYLWYVPAEKCYSEVLVDAYRIVCNLQQRKQHELRIRERLVNKMNRKDVLENPDLLSDPEKKEIEQMKKVMERLEVAKARIGSVIMILRDF
ncbi:hypothetical protein BY458DRAFT_445574 [Sporodiniella umbellata]|nr:hypothetical protein BY458DRAFT_445574 [Sporodiniella umbellata]